MRTPDTETPSAPQNHNANVRPTKLGFRFTEELPANHANERECFSGREFLDLFAEIRVYSRDSREFF